MRKEVLDMFASIKNAYLAGQKSLEVPYSHLKEKIVKILVSEGFAKKVEAVGKEGRKTLEITLLYKGKKPALSGLKAVSKPSLRVYVKKGEIKNVLGGTGISIISTSRGLMTQGQARKEGLGGEVICEVW